MEEKKDRKKQRGGGATQMKSEKRERGNEGRVETRSAERRGRVLCVCVCVLVTEPGGLKTLLKTRRLTHTRTRTLRAAVTPLQLLCCLSVFVPSQKHNDQQGIMVITEAPDWPLVV